jgi:hypothetical protein
MNAYVRLVASMAFAGLLAFGAMSGAWAQAPNEPVTYYGLTFPVEIGGARRISVRDYETTHPGLGYSAGYQLRNITHTVYIYDSGVSRIPDDLRSPVVTQQLAQAHMDIVRARPAGSVEDTGHFTIVDRAQRPRLTCDAVTIKNGFNGDTPGAPPADSYVCVGIVNGKFFKVRTSMLHRPDAEEVTRSFLGSWVDSIWGAGAQR